MNSFMKSCRSLRIHLTRFLEGLLIAAVLVLVLDVLWGVFSRYVLGDQSGWTEELARMLLIQVSLLGAAAAFGEKAHLGVDFFTGLFDPSARRIAAILSCLIVLFFAGAVLVSGGWKLVARTFELNQQLMALGIAKGFIYLCVPISGFFIILVTLEQLMETCLNKESAQ